MNAGRFLQGACAGMCIISLSGCDEANAPTSKSFQSQYASARTALEQGDYTTANRIYAALLGRSGPLDDRIKLEMAHSYLRAGNFDTAARLSGEIAEKQTGTARSAALSVRGTAMHEMGLQLLAKGSAAEGSSHLKSAQTALAEVLRENPELDPLGSLAGRKASIAKRLN